MLEILDHRRQLRPILILPSLRLATTVAVPSADVVVGTGIAGDEAEATQTTEMRSDHAVGREIG